MRSNKKGFSLVEVLAVIALLGVVSIIAIAAFGGIRKKVKDSNYTQIINELKIAGEKYTAKTGMQEMTVQYLVDAGLLSGSNGSDKYKGFDDNDLTCLVVNTKTSEVGFYGTDKAFYSFSSGDIEKLDKFDCKTGKFDSDIVNVNKNPQEIFEKTFDIKGLYEIVLTDSSGNEIDQYCDLNWCNGIDDVYAYIKIIDQSKCTDAFKSYKGDTVFKAENDCSPIGKQSLIISSAALTGTEIETEQLPSGYVYGVKFENVEGTLKFDYTISGITDGNKNDVQYYLTRTIKIDNTEPTVDLPDTETNSDVCFYHITVKDSYSKIKDEDKIIINKKDYCYQNIKDCSNNNGNNDKTINTIKDVDYRYRNIKFDVYDNVTYDYKKAKSSNKNVFSDTGVGVQIKFDMNTGDTNANASTQTLDSVTVYREESYGELPKPTYDYFDFAGWFNKKDVMSNDAKEVTSSTKVDTYFNDNNEDCNQTLYAKWKAYIKYNDSTYSKNSCVDLTKKNKIVGYKDQKWSEVNTCTPSRSNFQFDSWYYTNSSKNIPYIKMTSETTVKETGLRTKDAQLYPQWKAKITFKDNDLKTDYNKNVIEGYSFTYGESVSSNTWDTYLSNNKSKIPAKPTRDGYIFLGWFTSEQLSNKLTATPAIDENGNVSSDFASKTVDSTGNITLYAGWQKKYNIEYKEGSVGIEHAAVTFTSRVNGMPSPNPQTVSSDKLYHISDSIPSRVSTSSNLKGKQIAKFLYWQGSDGKIYYPEQIIELKDITSNLTLTAQWEDLVYSITYLNLKGINGNGIDYGIKGSGEYLTIKTPSSSDDNYDFLYWKERNKTSSVVSYYANEQYTEERDIELVAYWEKVRYDIYKFDKNTTQSIIKKGSEIFGTVASVIADASNSMQSTGNIILDGINKLVGATFNAIAKLCNIIGGNLQGNVCESNCNNQPFGIWKKNVEKDESWTLSGAYPEAIDKYRFDHYAVIPESSIKKSIILNGDESSYKNEDSNLPNIVLYARYISTEDEDVKVEIEDHSIVGTKKDNDSYSNVNPTPSYKINYKVGGSVVHVETPSSNSVRVYKYSVGGTRLIKWTCSSSTRSSVGEYANGSGTITFSGNKEEITCTGTTESICDYDRDSKGKKINQDLSGYSETNPGGIGPSKYIFDPDRSDFRGPSVGKNGTCEDWSGNTFSGAYSYHRKANTSLASEFGVKGMLAYEINKAYSCNFHIYWCGY